MTGPFAGTTKMVKQQLAVPMISEHSAAAPPTP